MKEESKTSTNSCSVEHEPGTGGSDGDECSIIVLDEESSYCYVPPTSSTQRDGTQMSSSRMLDDDRLLELQSHLQVY